MCVNNSTDFKHVVLNIIKSDTAESFYILTSCKKTILQE
jgi:hypothetical protein